MEAFLTVTWWLGSKKAFEFSMAALGDPTNNDGGQCRHNPVKEWSDCAPQNGQNLPNSQSNVPFWHQTYGLLCV